MPGPGRREETPGIAGQEVLQGVPRHPQVIDESRDDASRDVVVAQPAEPLELALERHVVPQDNLPGESPVHEVDEELHLLGVGRCLPEPGEVPLEAERVHLDGDAALEEREVVRQVEDLVHVAQHDPGRIEPFGDQAVDDLPAMLPGGGHVDRHRRAGPGADTCCGPQHPQLAVGHRVGRADLADEARSHVRSRQADVDLGGDEGLDVLD